MFLQEDAKTAGELKHKRLVKLLGYCCEEDEGLLVAEFMPNDTLAKRLFQGMIPSLLSFSDIELVNMSLRVWIVSRSVL